MHLLNLPAEILSSILEQTVLSIGPEGSIRLLSVCKLFSQEIPRLLIITGTFEDWIRKWSRFKTAVKISLWARFMRAAHIDPYWLATYLRYSALHQRIRDAYLSDLWEIVDSFMLLRDDKSDQSTLQVLDAACVCMAHYWCHRLAEAIIDKQPFESSEYDRPISADQLHASQLTVAAFIGDMTLVEAAAREASLTSCSPVVGPPLMAAVLGGHIDVAKYLLEGGASVNYRDAGLDESAVGVACRYGNDRMARLLLNPKYRFSPFSLDYGLRQAAIGNNVSLFQMMLEAEKDAGSTETNIYDNLILALPGACFNGALQMVEITLNTIPSSYVRERATTPFFYARSRGCRLASFRGHAEIVRLLLSPKVDSMLNRPPGIRFENQGSAEDGASEGHLPVVKVALEGAQVVIRGPICSCCTPPCYKTWKMLDLAVENGHQHVAEYLIKDIAPTHDIDLKHILGRLLRSATARGDLGMCRLLAKHGADVKLVAHESAEED